MWLKFSRAKSFKNLWRCRGNSGSWPAQVYVTQTVYFKELNLTMNASPCGGTLINRRTVLYAALCVSKRATLNNITYLITPKEKFPTFESMFKVYVGTHNRSAIEPEAKILSVSKIITVCIIIIVGLLA